MCVAHVGGCFALPTELEVDLCAAESTVVCKLVGNELMKRRVNF